MLRLRVLAVALLILAACSSSPAVPTLISSADLGGDGFDFATAVATDPLGGYFAALDYRSSDSNSGDVDILSFSLDDALRWSRIVGGPLHDTPFRNSIVADDSGGLYVGAGLYDAQADDRDLALLRLDQDGNLLWQRVMAGVPGDQRPHALALAGDGSVFVGGHNGAESAGQEPDRGLLMRVGADGEVMWQESLGGSGSAEIYSGAVDSADDFVVAGNVDNAGDMDAMVAKISPTGKIVWQYRWGFPGSPERVWDVVVGPQDDIYVAGPLIGAGDGGDTTFVLKLDRDGSLLWARTWSVLGNNVWSHGAALRDGVLVLSGIIGDYVADGQPEHNGGYLLGVSAGGDLLWQAVVGSSATESIEGIRFAPDGTLIAVGQGAQSALAVAPLSGEWTTLDTGLQATDLEVNTTDLPFVAGDLTVGPGPDISGGGQGADALVARIALP